MYEPSYFGTVAMVRWCNDRVLDTHFPIPVRSKKLRRYNKANHGTNRKSIFLMSFRSSTTLTSTWGLYSGTLWGSSTTRREDSLSREASLSREEASCSWVDAAAEEDCWVTMVGLQRTRKFRSIPQVIYSQVRVLNEGLRYIKERGTGPPWQGFKNGANLPHKINHWGYAAVAVARNR